MEWGTCHDPRDLAGFDHTGLIYYDLSRSIFFCMYDLLIRISIDFSSQPVGILLKEVLLLYYNNRGYFHWK